MKKTFSLWRFCWKMLFWTTFTFIVIFALSFFWVLHFYKSQAQTVRDCGVVFGAAVWRDDIPSHALLDRTLEAADLYKSGRIECIVLSGGASTYGSHEVDVMQKVLLENDISANALIFDKEGTNTRNTLKNLDPKKSYVLISNDFHLARINLLAKKQDLTHFDVQASTYRNGRYPKEPYFFFREVVANIYYFLELDTVNAPKAFPVSVRNENSFIISAKGLF